MDVRWGLGRKEESAIRLRAGTWRKGGMAVRQGTDWWDIEVIQTHHHSPKYRHPRMENYTASC